MDTPLSTLDKTSLDLISIVITGSGIFAALAEYSSGEIYKAYFGSNPHAVKARVINSVITKVFLSLAVFGTLLQVGSIVLEPMIPPRNHGPYYYLMLFLICSILMFFILRFSVNIAHKVAKKFWFSEAVKSKKASFINIEGSISKENPAVLKSADHHLADIERLLEITPASKVLSERVSFLKPIFDTVERGPEDEDR